MENLTVNSVYGTGLFEAIAAADKTAEACESLNEVKCVFKENPDLFDLLCAPTIAASERREITAEIFGGKVPEEVLNFLRVLIDKRRMDSFFGIVGVYEQLVDQRNGVTGGRLVTATDINEKQLANLESETGRLLSKNVKLKEEIDPSILGGCRIYIDGKLIDASLKTKLDKLKEKLV